MTSDTISEDEDFSFSGMFHTCTNGFNWDINSQRSNDDEKFTGLCNNFYYAVNDAKTLDYNFIKYCKVLGIYLKHIENNKSSLNKVSCCKLFYYRLKNDIMDKISLIKCSKVKDCYQKMIDQNTIYSGTDISDICIKYSEHIEQDTFKVLAYMFDIYTYIDLFNNRHMSNTGKVREFKSKINDLVNYHYKNKIRLKAELQKIIEICQRYITSWTSFPKVHDAGVLKEDNWISEITRKIEILGNETLKEERAEDVRITGNLQMQTLDEQISMSHVIDDISNTGISIGTIYISFSILIITFILVRKLRRVLKKNKKKNLGLMDTFDFEYKNSLDDMYKIAYS
ncbi:variable surface protein [Plasmodium gonderi]|uniref:Variable surface protein n=1 Tax=Plasmodium gonderi TaxID=77519 RepID=A0A1Y1JQY1_PLAGO|nr:variable surface protein [Plasmodium gonderi]GAW83905.1 variable surface protein [Plasmodium gonderi]